MSRSGTGAVEPVDPFDLPDWLGTADVVWSALSGVRGARRITGRLAPAVVTAPGDGSGRPGPLAAGRPGSRGLDCDLLAADVAYPEPQLDDTSRRRAHQAWELGQVLLVRLDGRLTLPVPGTAYSADGVLETLGRFARALGADPSRFTVALRL